MLAKIEQAILDRLKEKKLEVLKFEIKKEPSGYITPSVSVAIEGADFKRVTVQSFKQVVDIFVTVMFKHMGVDGERRKGIYPIIQGIVDILTLQKLGLQIDPLVPEGFRNVTSEENAQSGYLFFQLRFKTGFIVEPVEDEVAGELLKIGLDYYLKPGDDIKDASDEVTLRT
ncbi:MAG: DUF1834 family protein [Thermodesulfovibrionales bacterium]|nr:DUF1834 family protein [Thermodesulfovibrionales bacterium]